jgi:hypothetical protein
MDKEPSHRCVWLVGADCPVPFAIEGLEMRFAGDVKQGFPKGEYRATAVRLACLGNPWLSTKCGRPYSHWINQGFVLIFVGKEPKKFKDNVK